MSRKAQMEVMGLVVIVILIVMGLLFAVRFIVFKDEPEYREDYLNTQLAANTLNTLLVTTDTTCKNIAIKELLQDRAKANPTIECPGEVNTTIDDLLKATLASWKVKYRFEAGIPGQLLAVSGEVPASFESRERKVQFLPTESSTMALTLDIYS